MRLEKMVDLSGSEQRPEFQTRKYRRKEGEKGLQKRKYSKCDPRGLESLIYRGQKPSGSQKTRLLKAYPEVTRRLTATSTKTTLIKTPKRHVSHKHQGNLKRRSNPTPLSGHRRTC